ncbi:hypothetical protein AB0I91_38600 [Actinosynnema sp. NPDC049800]
MNAIPPLAPAKWSSLNTLPSQARSANWSKMRCWGEQPAVVHGTMCDDSTHMGDALTMTVGRAVLITTFIAVAGLGVWFAVAEWADANKIAAVASALGAVAAVGVAVWAALRGTNSGRSVVVSHTGDATAEEGADANTGIRGKARGVGSMQVRNTGNAKATGGGNANTGIQLD